MQFFLLEIVTSCGLSFVYGDHGPYIYKCFLDALEDVDNCDEEALIEVYIQPTGEISTSFYGWEVIQQVLIGNDFTEEEYKEYVKSFLYSDSSCL